MTELELLAALPGQAFCKQITDGKTYGANSRLAEQYDRAARAWIAFDPDRSSIRKIQVKDIGSAMDQMRAVTGPLLVSSGNKGAPHA